MPKAISSLVRPPLGLNFLLERVSLFCGLEPRDFRFWRVMAIVSTEDKSSNILQRNRKFILKDSEYRKLQREKGLRSDIRVG